MTVFRIPILLAALGAVLVLGCCGSYAAEPPADPLSIADRTPSFRAPEQPPGVTLEEPVPPSEPAAPLALQDALALALMRSPELVGFSWEARASEARRLQARKYPNPELDVRLWRLDSQRGIPNVESRRVILSQVFEIGGKRRRRVDLAQVESDLAGLDYEAKRVEVATSVAIDFVAVLGAQRRVDAQQRLLAYLEEVRTRVITLVAGGSMRPVEVPQATRQVGLARIELQRAESELAALRYRLAASWDGDSPHLTEAAGELDVVAPIPDIDTVMKIAARSPAIGRGEAALAHGQAALALAKARRVPDLKIGAGVRWYTDLDEQDYLLDFGIALPLFDRKQGDVRAARYEMARAQAGIKAAAASDHEDIARYYYRLTESAERSRTLTEEVLPAARATVEAFRLAFERQGENLNDLLDARHDVARAEVALANALVDQHQALAALEGIVGESLWAAD